MQDLERILTDSRQFNRDHQITGVLLYNDGTFAQCIEGEVADVEAVYRRIRASRLHHTLTEILSEPVAARSFPDWHMGFLGPQETKGLSLAEAEWTRLGNESGKVSSATHVHSLIRILRESLNV